MIVRNSSFDLTLYRANFSPLVLTAPTLKNSRISFNSSKSFACKEIMKQGAIVQPIVVVLDFKIDTEKHPSASEKPVTHAGFNLGSLDLFSILSNPPNDAE